MKVLARHTTLWASSARAACPAAVLAAALVVSPGCARPSASLQAQSLVRQHREEDAVALLRRDLAAHPDDVPARRLLVRLLGFTGDMPGARAETEELARRLGPGDPTPYLELGHALELAHRYEEALAAYDEAAAAAPSSPAGPREGGMRTARWGEIEEARPRLEEAVKRGAGDAETWHALGLVRLHLGDAEGAEQAYHAGTAVAPAEPECWLGLATVAVSRGDAAGALAAYERLLVLRPRFAAAELGRAWALAKLGRKDEASRALDHAEELGAPAPNVARQRAALTTP
ncbi:MAG: tetratricopeptide repeat protein [Polyangiaceae bacterium]|jgi:tetratricopeptide (TPR) repeat protein